MILRRRRTLSQIIKMSVLASAMFFVALIILSKSSTSANLQNLSMDFIDSKEIWNIAQSNNTQPSLQRLDMDKIKLLQKMQIDADEEERHKKALEIERQERAIQLEKNAKIVPPFQDVFKTSTTPSSESGDLGELEKRLINEGLLIPRWSFQEEAVQGDIGEKGAGWDVKKEDLNEKDAKEYDEGWDKNAFNQYVSDRISLHRSLPDIRDAECTKKKYRDNLPQASVIIIFHNEAWTVLLRTVHSVLDRSPPHLVKEIILVDDFSDLDHLKDKLDDYVKKLGKVRVMRGKKREGLIRARLLGASVATAPVLIFLDSHCEATMGWLEPLLDRIAENETNVVAPIIDVINDKNLKYHFSTAKSTSIGGFDWNLQFNWHPIPQREFDRRKSDVDPVQSPTMAGGLFGISKHYFEKLGTYDPGMDIWGGENLELSFRVWMCGGTLEQVLCSHVGHIFRHRSPYAWKTGVNVVKKNSIRVAEVWMDDYKKYYYERFGNDLGDFGDISSRIKLRKDLKCKTFQWYLTNIFPELFIPGDAIASGEIRNKAKGKFSDGTMNNVCIDSAVDKNANEQPVKHWPCHGQGGNQYWMLSEAGEIRRDEGCIDYPGKEPIIYPCHSMQGNQKWVYLENNHLYHPNSDKCLGLSADLTKLEMHPCQDVDSQVWLWQRQTPAHKTTMLPTS